MLFSKNLSDSYIKLKNENIELKKTNNNNEKLENDKGK